MPPLKKRQTREQIKEEDDAKTEPVAPTTKKFVSLRSYLVRHKYLQEEGTSVSLPEMLTAIAHATKAAITQQKLTMLLFLWNTCFVDYLPPNLFRYVALLPLPALYKFYTAVEPKPHVWRTPLDFWTYVLKMDYHSSRTQEDLSHLWQQLPLGTNRQVQQVLDKVMKSIAASGNPQPRLEALCKFAACAPVTREQKQQISQWLAGIVDELAPELDMEDDEEEEFQTLVQELCVKYKLGKDNVT